jgi:hypothetical protein
MSSQDEVLEDAVEIDDGSTVLRRIGDNPRCQTRRIREFYRK